LIVGIGGAKAVAKWASVESSLMIVMNVISAYEQGG
jgi:hypothetical protein